jgi:hypothetical protein
VDGLIRVCRVRDLFSFVDMLTTQIGFG